MHKHLQLIGLTLSQSSMVSIGNSQDSLFSKDGQHLDFLSIESMQCGATAGNRAYKASIIDQRHTEDRTNRSTSQALIASIYIHVRNDQRLSVFSNPTRHSLT